MGNEIRTFRDLVAWQKAMDLARAVYGLSRAMPAEEKFGLVQQMRRAAVSVPGNIAEGYARQSTSEYVRFLKIARGSLAELATQVELAATLDMIVPDELTLALIRETDRVLQGLIRGVQATTSHQAEHA